MVQKRRMVISDDEPDDDASDTSQTDAMAVDVSTDVEWQRRDGKPGWWAKPQRGSYLRQKEDGAVQLELICGICKTVEKLFRRCSRN